MRVRDVHWQIAGALPVRARRHYLYAVGTGRWGRFEEPSTFAEKVQWRILHDRRPGIVRACDKLEMKAMAREIVPGDELKIPRTIWSGTDLRDAPDLNSVGPWVLKPNHSSGEVIFGPPAPADLASRVSSWLRSKPAELLGEWGYTQARPLLLLEERLPVPGGAAPDDYKVHVHDGIPRFIQLSQGRFGKATMSFFDPEWNLLDIRRRGYDTVSAPKPAELDRMLNLAGRLGAGWDFMRVDFYLLDGDIWFGEFSPYPGGGVGRLSPRDAHYRLGRYWMLPSVEEVAGPSTP